YTTLRHVGLNWQQCDDILRPIGSLLSRTSQKHTEAFFSGDFQDFTSEHRGGKHTSAFFDDFPQIETEAKVYTLTRCSDKAANFSVNELAKFIDEKYYETTGTTKPKDSELIRSEASVRYRDSNGKAQVLDCFFVNGPNRGLSKGLAVIAKELNVKNADRLTLPQLRAHLADHPAFQNAIGAKNMLKSSAKYREFEKQQLQSLIKEKLVELERLRTEYESLQKTEREQNEKMEQLSLKAA
ncbi:unnamed protein product, partial [Rotaria sordida]